jgi:hypothetical protein
MGRQSVSESINTLGGRIGDRVRNRLSWFRVAGVSAGLAGESFVEALIMGVVFTASPKVSACVDEIVRYIRPSDGLVEDLMRDGIGAIVTRHMEPDAWAEFERAEERYERLWREATD